MRFVVAKKTMSKKAEQAHRRRARDPVLPPPHPARFGPPRTPAHPGASQALAYTPLPVNLLLSQRHSLYHSRTTESSFSTASSARFKSPRSFSTRTRRPWQQWRRRRRCGRRAGHACALPVARWASRDPHYQSSQSAVLSDTLYTSARHGAPASAPLPLPTSGYITQVSIVTRSRRHHLHAA